MNLSRFKTKKFYIAIVIVVIILIVALPVALYVYNPSAKFTQSIFKTLPYPVAIIDGKSIITTRTLLADTDAVKHFYETQDFFKSGMRVDFSTEEGQMRVKIKEKEVLNKLIEDIIVMKTSHKKGIDVSAEEARKNIISLARKEGSLETFEQNLKKLYGWDLDQFKNKVVIPQLYLKELVSHYIEKEEDNSESWKRIQGASNKTKEDNSNFCEVVAEYSEGKGSDNCGEIGWFEREYLEPEIAATVFEMEAGNTSSAVKSSLGYHIIFLDEVRQIEKDGVEVEEVKLKQVFIRSGGFLEWIRDEKRSHRVWILMKDYKWNNEDASVEFRDDRLEKKEDRLRIKSEGDPVFY